MERKMTETIVHEFFSNGCQYYIAGRYAVFAALNPVAGNLMHHAIEHFLKGGLVKTKSIADLRRLRHKLPDVWAAFKARANDPTLDQFDDVVSTLHEFEELRYPDPNSPGMQCGFDITKAGAAAVAAMKVNMPATPTSSLPEYSLVLEEIDELVAAIFAAASRNPKAYFGAAFKREAQEYLVKDNAVCAIVEAVPAVKPAA
jgi:hypothetical protein